MPKTKEFVSTDSSDSESETEVKDKKRKKEVKEKSTKKAKKESSSEEENSWELGNNRFAEVKEFKGRVFVDIREKYMDKNTAEMKPGKKGIFLTVEQWKKLIGSADAINAALSKM